MGVVHNLRLTGRLLRDSRVPLLQKLPIPMALGYLLFPRDLIPDFFRIVGWLDDVVILWLALSFFLKICNPSLVEEHREKLVKRDPKTGGEIITDAAYRVLEDDNTKGA